MKKNIKNTEEFDSFFKDKYTNDAITPPNDLWENINRDLKFKNISANYKSIYRLKVTVFALSVALIGTLAYFQIVLYNLKQNNNREETITQHFNLEKEKQEIKNLNSIDKINNEIKNNNTKEKNNKQVNEKIKQKQLANAVKNNVFEKKHFTWENSKIKAKNSFNTNNINKTQKDYLRKLNLKDFTNNNNKEKINKVIDNEKTLYVDTSKNNNIIIKDEHEKKNVIDENNINYTDSIINYNIVNNSNNKTVGEEDNTISTFSETKIDTANNNITNNKKINIKKNLAYEDSLSISEDKKVNLFKNSIKKDNFSYGLYFTPQYSYRLLFANNKYIIPDLGVDYFKEKEDGSMGLRAGMQFLYKLNDNLKISSGFEYSMFSQKMTIRRFDIKQDETSGYYTYTSMGRNNLTLSSSIPIDSILFLKSSSVYSFVNIPLTAEYMINDNIFINGGINYSFLFSENVLWRADNYDGDFSIELENVSGLRTSNFSFILGLGYKYELNRKYSIIANPQITSFITSISNKMPVNTYPYSFGLKLSLRRK